MYLQTYTFRLTSSFQTHSDSHAHIYIHRNKVFYLQISERRRKKKKKRKRAKKYSKKKMLEFYFRVLFSPKR